MSVVGFDLGNKSSIVAVARRRGIEVLQNEVGNRKTASYVGFSGNQRLLGDEAVAQMSSNVKNTIVYMKRLIGRKWDDPEMKEELAHLFYKTQQSESNGVSITANYDGKPEVFSPEQVLAALFSKLKAVTEAGMDGQRVVDCVLACPAYWTDFQRRAYLDAANIAGLNVLRLMNETTAIALNYGILRPLPKDTSNKVLFIDVGQTAAQASVVSFVMGKLTVLGTATERNCGGRDFDRLLGHHFAAEIQEKHKMDVLSQPKPTLKLMKECEKVKKVLSANSSAQFNVEYIMNDKDVSSSVTRADLERLAQPLIERLLACLDSVLKTAGVTKEELHAIEVVGGTTRVPCVQKAITEFFGKPLSKTCDSDESVARGCALQCAMLSPNFRVRDFEVHDIAPYAIQINWGTPGSDNPTESADNTTDLFSVKNPVPSVKMISFKDRKEPFELVARYADVSALPPGTPDIIGRFTVAVPAVTGDKPPKIKVRVKLNLHGVVDVISAQQVEEIKEEPEPEPEPEAGTETDAKMDEAAEAPKEGEEKPAEEGEKPKEEATEGEEKPAEAGAEEKMDTSADKAEEKPKEEKKKKKKVKRTDLKIDAKTQGMTQKGLQLAFEREAAMANADRVIAETNEARNALESYVLEMRSKVQGGELSKFILEKDGNDFAETCTTTEDWLYDDGMDAQKSTFKKKIEELRKIGDKVERRAYEAQHRQEYVSSLKSLVGKWERLVASTEEQYAHIEEEEKKKASDEIRKVDNWLSQQQTAQGKLADHEDPVLTCASMQTKGNDLEKFCAPIMNKPKPKPKEEPKPEPEKTEEKAAEGEKTEEPAAAGEANSEPAAEDKPEDTPSPMETTD